MLNSDLNIQKEYLLYCAWRNRNGGRPLGEFERNVFLLFCESCDKASLAF